MGFKTQNELVTAHINILGSSKTIRKTLLKRLKKSQAVMNYRVKLTGASGKTIIVMAQYVTTLDQKDELGRIKGSISPIGRTR
jgi:hypothetical protein